jgi:hypothetical protein
MNRGGMPGGFRTYSTGFGGGVPRGGGQRPGQRQQPQEQQGGVGALFQLLPVLLLFAMSFFNLPGETATNHTGGSQYFSLTVSPNFVGEMVTFSGIPDDFLFTCSINFLTHDFLSIHTFLLHSMHRHIPIQ